MNNPEKTIYVYNVANRSCYFGSDCSIETDWLPKKIQWTSPMLRSMYFFLAINRSIFCNNTYELFAKSSLIPAQPNFKYRVKAGGKSSKDKHPSSQVCFVFRNKNQEVEELTGQFRRKEQNAEMTIQRYSLFFSTMIKFLCFSAIKIISACIGTRTCKLYEIFS